MSCYIQLGNVMLGYVCLKDLVVRLYSLLYIFSVVLFPFFNKCSCVNEPARPRCNDTPEFNSIGIISRRLIPPNRPHFLNGSFG